MVFLRKDAKHIKENLLQNKVVVLLITVQHVKEQHLNQNVQKVETIKDGKYMIMDSYQEVKI